MNKYKKIVHYEFKLHEATVKVSKKDLPSYTQSVCDSLTTLVKEKKRGEL